MEHKTQAWLTLLAFSLLSVSCSSPATYSKNSTLPTDESVTLTLVGKTPTFKAMEGVIASFGKLYPNCSVQYEYIQDYDNLLPKRLSNNDNVDLFLTTSNLTSNGAGLRDYALDLFEARDAGTLDLADTFEGFVTNFAVNDGANLYAMPLGGEIRGMFVNKTLLASQELTVPTNWEQFLTCCSTLKSNATTRAQNEGLAAGKEDHWFVPVQGNPGPFGGLLMYPYVCSLIANSDDYESAYAAVNDAQEGISEMFREPMARLYQLAENRYYDYGYVEDNYYTVEDSNLAQLFLGLEKQADGTYLAPEQGGGIAFIPSTMSFKSTIDKMADDYHSSMDYDFILSPVGDESGYAYLSPSIALAINKNSPKLAWATEFLNYLMDETANTAFAKEYNILPNTKTVFETVKKTLGADEKHTCHLGQVSFRYSFWGVMSEALKGVCKSNRAKYMQNATTMYPLDYYMSKLEASFAKYRV
jgi:ABC-type glycerol-3-phosphate transport system substrate-binding protein